MKLSRFALLPFVLSASLAAWPQSNSAQPASDAPKIPLAAPSAGNNADQPPQPKTEILDSSGSGSDTNGHDPILDPPPIPTGSTTLVGGTVKSVDRIRGKMTLEVFGGGQWKIGFDERTHIFRNGAETTQEAIKKGQRVYVDTMLDKTRHDVFARNIRLGLSSAATAADADGQVIDLNEASQTVTLRDQINSVPVHFLVDSNTRIVYGSTPATLHDLKPGALIHITFSPAQPNRGLAREITVIAEPGSAFTYVGKITYLDVHRGVLALQDSLDQKSYEVNFDPAQIQDRDQLAVGSQVKVVAIFEGSRYSARSISLAAPAGAPDNN